jgi:Mg2+ and Co2+ transporter CorA
MERRREAAIQRQEQAQKDAENQRFDLMISIIGAITIPYVLISGIFGMNVDNLPTHVDFTMLMIYTGISSLVLMIILYVIRYFRIL